MSDEKLWLPIDVSSLRVHRSTHLRLDGLSARFGLKKSQVLRFAIVQGLADLEKNGLPTNGEVPA